MHFIIEELIPGSQKLGLVIGIAKNEREVMIVYETVDEKK
jgi:hypothetical protein